MKRNSTIDDVATVAGVARVTVSRVLNKAENVRPETRARVLRAVDELGYSVTQNKMTVHDLQATVLQLMGMDATRFSFRYQGLNQRLIGPTDEAVVRTDLIR